MQTAFLLQFCSFSLRIFSQGGSIITCINADKNIDYKHNYGESIFDASFFTSSTGMKVCLVAVFVFGGD